MFLSNDQVYVPTLWEVVLYDHFITRLLVSGTRSSFLPRDLNLFLLPPLNEQLMIQESLYWIWKINSGSPPIEALTCTSNLILSLTVYTKGNLGKNFLSQFSLCRMCFIDLICCSLPPLDSELYGDVRVCSTPISLTFSRNLEHKLPAPSLLTECGSLYLWHHSTMALKASSEVWSLVSLAQTSPVMQSFTTRIFFNLLFRQIQTILDAFF